MHPVKAHVQICIPFRMLHDTYLERVLAEGLHPEVGIDAEALDGFEKGDFARVAAELARRSLRVTLHGPFMDLAPGSRDPWVRRVTRRRLEQLLAMASVFRPVTVVCHAGFDRRRHGDDPAGWYERSLPLWRWLAQALASSGARLMLENVYEEDPDEMLPILAPLADQGVGFCLDIGHQAAFGKAPLERWCRRMADRIGQLHVHDNHGRADDHLALGRGGIDLPAFFALMKSLLARAPVVTLEVHREEDLAPSLAVLGRLWPW